MPLPLAAIAGVAARKAALSLARKKAGKKLLKEGVKRTAKTTKGAKKKISWIEIILVVLLFALPLDLIDIFNLTVIGKLATIVIDFITVFLAYGWFWFRVRESPSRKFLKNFLVFIAEMAPFVGLLPLWTLLVINVKTGWFDWLFAIPIKLLSLFKL